jgi:hypothetical protein
MRWATRCNQPANASLRPTAVTKREFELRAGESEIEVKELPDGVPFFTKQFVLRQSGRVVLEVRFEPARGRP